MFAVLKKSNGNAYLYKLNYNNSGAGTTSYISSVNLGSGDNNAASNYEVVSGGTTYKYIVTSKGFFNGNQKVIRVNGDGTYKVINLTITNGGNGSNKAKDFAWVSNHPSGNDFVGYDSNANDLLGAEITSHTNIGSNSEAMTIDLSVINGNIGSGIGSNSGAAMSLGNGDVYFLENNTGDLWLYDESAGSLTETNDDFNSSSNTDGAGCGIGLSGNDEFVPTVTGAQGSCSGDNKTVAVTLNNSGSDVAANYVVTYSINGPTSNLTTGTSVNGGASNTSLSVPAQANGTAVQLNWYAENSTYGLRTPSSGAYSVTVVVDASDCSSGPNDISSTVSQSLGTCSNGNATSTLSVRNNSSATGYYYVQYKIDSGSYQNASTNLSVGAGVTNTSLTQSVPSGSTITWRYIDSDTNNDFTDLTYTTLSASSTVSSCTTTFTTSTSAGSCSSGSSTPTISVTNTGNSTGYFDVQWSTDNSTWTTLQNGNAISSGATETYSVSSAQTHGTTVYFQVRSGLSNPSSGSYTAATSRTVDCPIIDVSGQQSLGSCSAGAKTSTLTLSNSNSANTTA